MPAESDKRFLIYFSIGLAAAMMIWIGVLFDTGKDDIYPKLTTPRQHSLVLGTSYASRGINPDILNQADLPYEGDLYNFAFSNPISRWGEAYSRAISLKLDPATTNGLFIVQVNPWSFRSPRGGAPDPEDGLFARLDSVAANPNLGYLLNNQKKTLLETLMTQQRGSEWVVAPDGWQHYVHDPNPDEVQKNSDKNLKKNFPSVLAESVFSEQRWQAFVKIVRMLDEHGTVVLVQLPSTDEHARLQDAWYPTFEERISRFARESDIRYLDFKGERRGYRTTDGMHLDGKSAVAFTYELAETLKTLNLWPQ